MTTVGTVLLEAGTGFSATPRWDGGALVELELSAQQALRSGSALPGTTATSGTSSVLALPLDEWTTVGESEQSSQSSNSGLTAGLVGVPRVVGGALALSFLARLHRFF